MMGFGLGFLGLAFMLLFWGGLIAGAVWLVGLLFPTARAIGKPTANSQLSAQDILNARYARGEITEEQYQQIAQSIQQP